MSINQETPERTLWWNQQQQQNPSITIQPQLYNNNNHQATWLNSNTPQHRFNLNIEDQEEDQNDDVMEEAEEGGTTQEEEKEPMFEKSLTPSDVGKLNRLVIPKQHAEKYFPLGGGGADSGLLLSFEDESGKCWRFRYSYWNSSQSYVLTKGWSRYVKDKRLDAGDVVLFLRHRVDSHRFFITWRRRHATPPAHVSTTSDGNGPVHPRGYPYPTTHHHHHHHHHSLPYQPDSLHAGGESQGQNQITQGGNSSSSSSSSGSKMLRLFGVNMECKPDIDSETFTPESSATQQFYYHHNQPSHSSSNPHHHILRQQPF